MIIGGGPGGNTAANCAARHGAEVVMIEKDIGGGAHLIVVGSGVTGVEFVHMFKSFGCEVTLAVSRQQVPPQKDP